MKSLRIIGIALILLGIVSYAFARYIDSEVAKGRKQIAEGQQTVDTINKFSGVTPYTEDVGEAITKDGQRQIDEGKMQANRYAKIAYSLYTIGIILFLVGIILVIIGFFVRYRQKK